MPSPSSHALIVATALLALFVVIPVAADIPDGYQTPPQAIVDIVDQAMTPQVQFGPDESRALMLDWRSLTSIEELSEEELRLAGLRFRPAIDGPSRVRPFTGLAVLDVATGRQTPVRGLPDGSRFINLEWSPDGRHASFTRLTADGVELWVVDLHEAVTRALTGPIVSLTADIEPLWIDTETVVAALVDPDRGAPPRESRVPKGPVVQENQGEKAAARTFQDLLQNSHDEALFDYYMTTRLASIRLDGSITKLGKPAIYWAVEPSPNGEYLLVETLHRPYSYLVPAFRFPMRSEVWTRDGEPVHLAYDRPLQESIPIAFGSVATGPRQITWRNDTPATLVWAEAQDGGDAAAEAEIRDTVYLHAAPFDDEPTAMASLGLRYGGTMWGDGDLAIVTEWWWKTRQLRSWRIHPDRPGAEPTLLQDRSYQDRYADPGNPTFTTNAFGRPVLLTDDEAVFLIGNGASPEGDRPFLDRLDLASGETERLFHSAAPYYERPIRVLDVAQKTVLTQRESVDEPPNYLVRDLDGDTSRTLTDFAHPTPSLQGLQKELIQYEREDGVQLTATLYLPPGYDKEEDGPLPMVMWAYPREFKDAKAAGQVDDSPYRFDRVGWWSQLVWLTQGYAVLDDPKMPIVGEGDAEPNDTFREQLVSSASAAVDEVVRRGVADRERLAIGGHSYGAFMTANLLAHSDLFAAGIARSGAYNRTLTPFGFQAEERSLWEAPDVYFSMSPFMHAEKVDEPILLIHGEADNNAGTYPMQSERFFNALKGHGATARLVMLPYESHGYRARESILHMIWETNRWLDLYVKNAESQVPDVDEVEEDVPELREAAGGR